MLTGRCTTLQVEDTKIFVSHRFAHTLMEAKVRRGSPLRLLCLLRAESAECGFLQQETRRQGRQGGLI